MVSVGSGSVGSALRVDMGGGLTNIYVCNFHS